MITRDPAEFFAFARTLTVRGEATTAKAAFLVAPEQFQLADHRWWRCRCGCPQFPATH